MASEAAMNKARSIFKDYEEETDVSSRAWAKIIAAAESQISEASVIEEKRAELEQELKRVNNLLTKDIALRESAEKSVEKLLKQLTNLSAEATTAKAELAVEKKAKAALESKNLASEKKAEAAELNMLKKIESLIESTKKIEAKEPKEPDMTLLERKIDRLLSQESKDDSMKVEIPALDVVRGANGKVLRLVPRTLN